MSGSDNCRRARIQVFLLPCSHSVANPWPPASKVWSYDAKAYPKFSSVCMKHLPPSPGLHHRLGCVECSQGLTGSCTKNGASSGPPTPICRHHDAAKSLSSHSHASAGANPSPTSTRLLVHLPIRIDWHLLHVASMHGAHRSGGNPGGRSTSALGHGAWTIWTADRQRRTAPLLSAWPVGDRLALEISKRCWWKHRVLRVSGNPIILHDMAHSPHRTKIPVCHFWILEPKVSRHFLS